MSTTTAIQGGPGAAPAGRRATGAWPPSCRSVGGPERLDRMLRWLDTLDAACVAALDPPPWMTVTDPERFLAALRHDAERGAGGPRAAGLAGDLNVLSRALPANWRSFNEAQVRERIADAEDQSALDDIGAVVRNLVENADLDKEDARSLMEVWTTRWVALVGRTTAGSAAANEITIGDGHGA